MIYNKEYDIKLPERNNPEYKYLENIDDYEYTNSIAFAMLVRTKSFRSLFNVKLEDRREKWIEDARKLGFDTYSLKRDAKFSKQAHVFYKQSVLKEDFESYTLENIGDKFVGLMSLITYYYKKKEIYVKKQSITDDKFDEEISFDEVFINYKDFSIPCKDFISTDEKIIAKSISKEFILRELEEEFLSTLALKDLIVYNSVIDKYWNKKPTVGDITDGLSKLINYYLKNNEIYIRKEKKNYIKIENLNTLTILLNHFNFFIPCIDRGKRTKVMKPISNNILLDEIDESKSKEDEKFTANIKLSDLNFIENDISSSLIINDIKHGLKKLIEYYVKEKRVYPNELINNSETEHEIYKVNFNDLRTYNQILLHHSNYYIPCKKSSTDDKIVMRKIDSKLPLKLLEKRFFEDVNLTSFFNFEKNIKIKPVYSFPELKFDEATIIDLPININLSSDELESYIKKVKELNLDLEHPLTTMGIKLEELKETSAKAKLDKGNKKKRIADAFYIHDIKELLLEKIKYLEKERDKELSKESDDYEIQQIEDKYCRLIRRYKGKDGLNNKLSRLTKLSPDMVALSATYTNHYIKKEKYRELITGVNTLNLHTK